MTPRKSAHSGRRVWEIEVEESESRRMANIRRRDTDPELRIRRILYDLGHRYRIENGDLPGRPDVANRSRRWAVFVHGCYWHRHPGCPKATVPRTNREFWLDKFDANRERDREAILDLVDLGFRVVVIWECELAEETAVRERLAGELASRLP